MAPGISKRFINYPDPLPGPEVPYRNDRKSGPALQGLALVVVATLMEWLGLLRFVVWRNGGFGSLRRIRDYLIDYEPRYDPTVLPLPVPDEEEEQVLREEVGAIESTSDALYYSVADYHAMYLSGELTPTAVARAILPLIRRDTVPPGEHSTAWFDSKVESVMKAAQASTLRYKEKRPLGPLDGVPTGVKDEYEVGGYKTCLGSKNDYTSEPEDGIPVTSWCVGRLEEAGAIIMGKLSMHEFGLDTTGNNPIYGTPRNPYNRRYYTGGSSSGSSYAVSAGLIPIALGSDGGGSIRIPASLCGVFGFKPSHGRVSFRPCSNYSITCAVLGPIAADIKSLATLFEVISAPHPTSHFPKLASFPQAGFRSEKRAKLLGVVDTWFAQATPAMQEICRGLISKLASEKGYTIVPIQIPFLVEGQIGHALTILTDGATLLPETKNLTAANRVLLAIGRTTPATDYLLAQKLRSLLMRHLAHLWKMHPGMIIVTPTCGCAGLPISSEAELVHGLLDGDRTVKSMEYIWLANFCGLPALTVPAGYVVPEGQAGAGSVAGRDVQGKLPVGLMGTGEWTDELGLLHFGADAEEVGSERRVRPESWVDVVERAREEMKRAEAGDLIDL